MFYQQTITLKEKKIIQIESLLLQKCVLRKKTHELITSLQAFNMKKKTFTITFFILSSGKI